MRIPLHILISCVFLHSSCHQSKEEFVYDKPVRTIVAGKILNPVSEIRTTGLAVSRIGFGQEEFELLIDTTGVFTFEFETYIPTDIWLTYQTNFLLLLHPGDSLYLELDGSKRHRPEALETLFLSGDRVSTNQQITSFQKAYFESSFCGNCGNWEIKESAIQNLEPKEFRSFADSLKTARENFLLTFSQNHTLNDESHSWAKAFLDESYFYDLTYYPNSHRKSKALKRSEWDVPIGYYDYFKFHSPAKESLHNGDAIVGFSNKYLFRFRNTCK